MPIEMAKRPQDGCERNHTFGGPKIAFFGHFGGTNFGNEVTFQAILRHLRPAVHGAHVTCICTRPEAAAAVHGVTGVSSRGVLLKPWAIHSPAARMMRKLIVGVPSELYRWVKSIEELRTTDALLIPGTGLLTDSHTLFYWGPYDVFRWSVAAKLCRCKLLFVSVGAGPLDSLIGRLLVKSSLSLADFRSYRDEATVQYLKGIGFRRDEDKVYPDLAYSLPLDLLPRDQPRQGRRRIVGLGLMTHSGMYGVEKTTSENYAEYLETLTAFAKWLLAQGYNIRLLIGDLTDELAIQEFRSLLEQRSITYEEGRVIDEPIASVDDLLKQIAATDFVVATRFHNVLLSLLLNKPSIAISFHHKCSSLMSQMGLSEYCQDINRLNADRLIEQFCDLEKNAETLKPRIKEKAEEFRRALDEQYERIFRVLRPDCQNDGDSLKAMTTR